MSKRIIAGLGVVAGLAVALAPVATFATDTESDQHTDTLNITVLPSCTFGSATLPLDPVSGISHTAGSTVAATDGGTAPTWSTVTASDGTGRTPDNASGTNANKSVDKLTYSMFAGTTRDDLGTTTMKIVCNNNLGYEVKAALGTLQEWENNAAVSEGATIAPSASYSASVSGYALFGVAQTGGVTVDAQAKHATAAPTRIAHKAGVTTAETGDSITVTYGIGVKPDQKAATYQGDVVYTLLQLAE